MKEIKMILKNEQSSLEELLLCFEQVKNSGDVAVIKFDGERKENQYTVFISFSFDKGRSMIRADGDNLREVLVKVLNDYAA